MCPHRVGWRAQIQLLVQGSLAQHPTQVTLNMVIIVLQSTHVTQVGRVYTETVVVSESTSVAQSFLGAESALASLALANRLGTDCTLGCHYSLRPFFKVKMIKD